MLWHMALKSNAVPVAASSSAFASARPTRPGVRPRSATALRIQDSAEDVFEARYPNQSSLDSGGDLRKLNRRTPDPLRERPHMIRQLRGHRRCPLRARTGLERPHRPAEVRAIHREECHRAMDPPILREAIRLPRLPRVSVAVRTVVALR